MTHAEEIDAALDQRDAHRDLCAAAIDWHPDTLRRVQAWGEAQERRRIHMEKRGLPVRFDLSGPAAEARAQRVLDGWARNRLGQPALAPGDGDGWEPQA